ncbi:MAG: cytochrome c-type biosis protein CcmE [Desulfonauticus sp.]|jgi:cytochrome c-type biogenesis protein CcmE|nr:MAG: Cytochrome c-type biogenesis protein CcmE [Desulfonauticus sp. 38_4375]MDK2920793.1 cytochrome c-type biosis protein CcmE [Desulfonauticus sp.]
MKKNYILAFLLILGAIIYLGVSALKEDKVYFLKVSEAVAMGLDKIDQARLFGLVEAKDFKQSKSKLEVNFLLADKENKEKVIPVYYQGALPDTFKPGVEVIVEGKMNHQSNIFDATLIMTKCPSKYKKKNN